MKPTLTRKLQLTVIIAVLLVSCLVGAVAVDRTPVEILYISDKYVLPARIDRPQGQFLMVIKNQSSFNHLVFHIRKSGSDADIVLADMDEEDGKYEALLNLDPGTYILFEPANPELICTLTITQ